MPFGVSIKSKETTFANFVATDRYYREAKENLERFNRAMAAARAREAAEVAKKTGAA